MSIKTGVRLEKVKAVVRKCKTWDRVALAQKPELGFCKAGVGGGCETYEQASLKRGEVALVLKKVGRWYVVEPQRPGGVALIDHASPLTMALWG